MNLQAYLTAAVVALAPVTLAQPLGCQLSPETRTVVGKKTKPSPLDGSTVYYVVCRTTYNGGQKDVDKEVSKRAYDAAKNGDTC